MRLGYNTNGTADHRWPQAIELMAEIGYRSVAITVDHHCLDPCHPVEKGVRPFVATRIPQAKRMVGEGLTPFSTGRFAPRLAAEVAAMRALLDRLGMTSVIETGARFLLDPRVKHHPTLMSADADGRQVRIDFLLRCIDIAADLGSQAVSFWSGVLREDLTEQPAWDRLAAGCLEVCDYAARQNVRLAFEPEPGMFIETMEQYAALLDRVDAPHFGLTIDVGHLQCIEDEPIPVHLRRWADRLFNVHIEDMRRGVHEHLPFGEGEIDFVPVLSTLREIGYTGGVYVELSRHSHVAPQMMQESYAFLQGVIDRMNSDAQ